MIKLKQLSHALALAKHRNFHRAAKAEHISQPAFSRSIRNLEDGLGAPLFDRQTTDIMPTLYGEALLIRAKSIFAETGELERELMLLKGLEGGCFAVASSCFPAELCVNRSLAKLVNRHPNLRCRAKSTNWRHVIELVLSRGIDLGVAEISVIENLENLQVEPLQAHQGVFYCRRGHPLLGRKKLLKADLDAYPLAMVRAPPRMAHFFPGKGSIDETTGDFIPIIEVENLPTARTLALNSDAFSATTLLQIEPWLRSGELEVLSYQEPRMKLGYGFIHLQHRMLSPATEAFMQLVRETEQENTRKNTELMNQWFPGFGT